jgi:hypothetical protein
VEKQREGSDFNGDWLRVTSPRSQGGSSCALLLWAVRAEGRATESKHERPTLRRRSGTRVAAFNAEFAMAYSPRSAPLLDVHREEHDCATWRSRSVRSRRGKPSAARHDRRLRNSRTLIVLAGVIYAYRLCHLQRHQGSTVLAETPAVSALLGRLQGLAGHGEPGFSVLVF